MFRFGKIGCKEQKAKMMGERKGSEEGMEFVRYSK